jgi:hypothetical protein
MWEYRQIGELWYRDATGASFVEHGYSGAGSGRNNAAMQSIHNVGPIPQGNWTIVSLTIENTPHGPYVLHLAACENTNTFGRSGFLIHGDSIKAPGTASQGCIILPRAIRERIWQSNDRQLTVI